VDAPAAILILVAKDLVDGALHPATIAGAQQGVHKDIVRLEHAVGLKLSAPIAIGVLQIEQPVFSPLDSFSNMLQAQIHPPKTRLRHMACTLRIT
jgi:hypothetical protein